MSCCIILNIPWHSTLFRVNLKREEAVALVAGGDLAELRASDQLAIERAAGNVFQGFSEGPLNFAPTYK